MTLLVVAGRDNAPEKCVDRNVRGTTYREAMKILLTEEVVRALDTLSSGANTVVAGLGGTGKSTVVEYFYKHTSRVGCVLYPTLTPSRSLIMRTVFAANHQRGTFEAWNLNAEAHDIEHLKLVTTVEIVVIENASLLSASNLDALDRHLREVCNVADEPFAGKQIVLICDPFGPRPGQLVNSGLFASRMWNKAVVDPIGQISSVIDTPRSEASAYGAFTAAAAFTSGGFQTRWLRQQHRQKGDLELAEIIKTVVGGKASLRMLQALRKREIGASEICDPFATEITASEKMVKAANNAFAYKQIFHDKKVYLVAFRAQGWNSERGISPLKIEEINLVPPVLIAEGTSIPFLEAHEQGLWQQGDTAIVHEVRLLSGLTVPGLDIDLDEMDPGDHIIGPWGILDRAEVTVIFANGCTKKLQAYAAEAGPLMMQPSILSNIHQVPMPIGGGRFVSIMQLVGRQARDGIIDITDRQLPDWFLYYALSRFSSLAEMQIRGRVNMKDLPRIEQIPLPPETHNQAVFNDAPACADEYVVVEIAEVMGLKGPVGRAVEIVAIMPDGEIYQSLLNPQRDLGISEQVYGLSGADLQLAPTLAQAWSGVESRLIGKRIVSSDLERLIVTIDEELMRHGVVSGLRQVAQTAAPKFEVPAGKDISENAWLTSTIPDDESCESETKCGTGYAMNLAMATKRELMEYGVRELTEPYEQLEEAAAGFQLTYSDGSEPRTKVKIAPHTDAEEVAYLLYENLRHVYLAPSSEEILSNFESEYGVEVARPLLELAKADQILAPGRRVGFGGVHFVEGKLIHTHTLCEMGEKESLEIAQNRSMAVDVLVVADPYMRSRKLAKAIEFSKPVITTADYYQWCQQKGAQRWSNRSQAKLRWALNMGRIRLRVWAWRLRQSGRRLMTGTSE
ncbi:MAG: hypothetical protein Q4P06_06355 [Actinomycetaceae bacterium]|nr:hypothetical protein [Actinomycetaceae bacterium]